MVELKNPSELVRAQLSVLYAAVAIEDFGIEFYRRLEACVGEATGKALMRGLARDELQHKETIMKEVERLSKGVEVGSVEADKRYAGIVPDKVFTFMTQNTCMTVKEEVQALEVGIDVEERSIQMYSTTAKEAKDKEVKKLLGLLVEIEKKHKKLLEENVHMLKLEGSWYGYSPILEG